MTFERFVHEQGTALLRFTCLLTGDHHSGQDLAQTTLLHALRRWSKVSGASNPQAYLRKIALNAHIDATRRRSTSETVGHRDDVADTASTHPRDRLDAPGADAPLMQREDLRARLAALPPRCREVLVLRYYADLDDEAIAAAMGTTASTVRATASRALAALRHGAPTPPATGRR